MIHFSIESKDEEGYLMLKYWFTKGISRNDLDLLQQRVTELCPKMIMAPDQQYQLTTKRMNRIYILVFKPSPNELRRQETLKKYESLGIHMINP